MSYKLCKQCGQPIKPGRHKPGEYEHAQGCPNDNSTPKTTVIKSNHVHTARCFMEHYGCGDSIDPLSGSDQRSTAGFGLPPKENLKR